MADEFQFDAQARLILARSLPGLATIILAVLGQPLYAGISLVLAVWADAAGDFVAHRRQWVKQAAHVQLDGFVDFLCFIWAPVQFLTALDHTAPVLATVPIFVLAGVFRLARFNVEGVLNGGYRGLPVTYNGYLFPLAALALAHLPSVDSGIVYCALLIVISVLMVSSRLRVPEL